MKKTSTLLITLFWLTRLCVASSEDTLSVTGYLDSLNASFHYQTGKVIIGDNLATLNVPKGYHYLDPKQSQTVLSDIWGNPPAETLGMLFPENVNPADADAWAIEISYSEEGFVKDEDAEDMDYDDLLTEMQKDTEEASKERVKQNYPAVKLIGWAAPPFYDAKNKKLHWAKELQFGSDSLNTLNYNIRILGRKGFLVLNAIGGINILPEVKKDINKVISSVEFNEGNKYADFNPGIDKIAAYGIGGLITGKILAKAGFFVLILKFWKVIAAGAVGLFALIRKFFFGKKEEASEEVVATASTDQAENN